MCGAFAPANIFCAMVSSTGHRKSVTVNSLYGEGDGFLLYFRDQPGHDEQQHVCVLWEENEVSSGKILYEHVVRTHTAFIFFAYPHPPVPDRPLSLSIHFTSEWRHCLGIAIHMIITGAKCNNKRLFFVSFEVLDFLRAFCLSWNRRRRARRCCSDF